MTVLIGIQFKFKQFAGFLGTIQSLTWIILSIILLIIHNQDPSTTIQNYDTYMGFVQYVLYMLYVKDYGRVANDQVLTGYSFIIVVWIYLILNLAWIFASINILLRQNNKMSNSLKLWSLATWSICLCDFIVTVILGTDYQKCLDTSSELQADSKLLLQAACANGMLLVLTIASKGFVLWLVNFAFSIVLLNIANNLKYHQPFGNYSRPYFLNPQINSPQPHRHSLPDDPYGQKTRSPIYPIPAQPNRHSPAPPSSVPSRMWTVHTSSPQSSPATTHRDNSNKSTSPGGPNWPSRGQILSNQTQRPFVLHTPPRRR